MASAIDKALNDYRWAVVHGTVEDRNTARAAVHAAYRAEVERAVREAHAAGGWQATEGYWDALRTSHQRRTIDAEDVAAAILTCLPGGEQ